MENNWETDIGGLLTELAQVQSELLETLHEKRELLKTNNNDALAAMAVRDARMH